jgi:hypothetical protein
MEEKKCLNCTATKTRTKNEFTSWAWAVHWQPFTIHTTQRFFQENPQSTARRQFVRDGERQLTHF